MKDWLAVLIIGLIGAAIIASLMTSRHIGFGTRFLYIVVGLVTITASMMVTLIAVSHLAKRKGSDDGYLFAGYLLGVFVTTPITLIFVYKIMEHFLN